ncbi:DUF5688 family protein [Acetivibrio ethanolgignens]|uniref:Uncharacterized protein n=1 Tax=Acetivibrio ethanolgignens TaxID=290052 RepID=A0A0V8QE48_9FIRM|nr:DUF5688 family protein [Acetivibrio ethanolgignens]KSV58875.1 hypothetical protein ASU35_11290 [Acetivibrio ethanolgignens]
MTKEKEYLEFVEEAIALIAKRLKLSKEAVRFEKGQEGKNRDRIVVETLYENGLKGVMGIEAAGLFLMYKRGMALEELAEEIARDREEKCGQETLEILQDMENYDKLKERLIVRAVSWERKREQISGSVYRRFGDIALVVYLVLRETEYDFLSAKVQRQAVEKWGKTEKEIFENAMINTHVLYPPRIYDWLKGDGKFSYQEGVFMNILEPVSLNRGIRGNCLTNVKQLNGATVLFYPGVAARIAALLEDDFYVAFTSVHEAMVHSVSSVDPRIILESLRSVNAANEEDEILSNRIYYYSQKEKALLPLD